ncbi:allantoate permease [Fusarium bulbicola]|nr:allantoate permease [Fusarium bulbicola]
MVKAVEVQHSDSITPAEATVHYDQKAAAADLETANYAQDAPVEIDDKTNKELFWTVNRRILACMLGTYFCQSLDKGTLGFSSVMGIQEDANLHGQQFSWLGTILYMGVLVGEYPTNFLLQKLPVAKYLATNVFCWGVVIACSAAAKNFASLMVVRFLLGVFESCVQPAFIIMTSMWYTKREQSILTSLWYCMTGVQLMVGGIIAWGVSHYKDGVIFPWQLLFLVLGLLTCVWGLFIGWWLPDSPMKAKCFNEDQKRLMVERVRANETGIQNKSYKRYQAIEAATDPIVWCYVMLQLTSTLIIGGLGVFSNLIISSFGFTYLQTQLLNIAQGAVTIIVMVGSATLATATGQTAWVMHAWTIPPIIGTAIIYSIPPTSSNRVGLLIAFYCTQFYLAEGNLIFSLISRNIAGQTKKSTTLAITFVAWAAGNMTAPQIFQKSDSPRYEKGFTAHFCLYVLFNIFLVILRLLLVRRNANKRKAALEVSHAADDSNKKIDGDQLGHLNAFADLTDKENPDFSTYDLLSAFTKRTGKATMEGFELLTAPIGFQDGSARLLTGDLVVHDIEHWCHRKADRGGIKPVMAVVFFNTGPDAVDYVKIKAHVAARAGVSYWAYEMPVDASTIEVMTQVKELNMNPQIHSILIQRPLPHQLNEAKIMGYIDPVKNIEEYDKGQADNIAADALVRLLARYGLIESAQQAKIHIAGFGNIITKEFINQMKRQFPYVSASKDFDLTHEDKHKTLEEEVQAPRETMIISELHHGPGFIKASMVKPEVSVLVDLGFYVTEKGVIGDVSHALFDRSHLAIAPTPGGVLPILLWIMMERTIRAKQMIVKENDYTNNPGIDEDNLKCPKPITSQEAGSRRTRTESKPSRWWEGLCPSSSKSPISLEPLSSGEEDLLPLPSYPAEAEARTRAIDRYLAAESQRSKRQLKIILFGDEHEKSLFLKQTRLFELPLSHSERADVRVEARRFVASMCRECLLTVDEYACTPKLINAHTVLGRVKDNLSHEGLDDEETVESMVSLYCDDELRLVLEESGHNLEDIERRFLNDRFPHILTCSCTTNGDLSKLVKSKILQSPLSKWFPQFEGGSDGDAALKFMEEQFRELAKANQDAYVHVADTHSAEGVIAAIETIEDMSLSKVLKELDETALKRECLVSTLG